MTSQPMREAEFRFELSRYRKTLLASEDENAKLWKFVNDVESAVDGRIFTTVSRVLVRGAIRDLRASLVTPGTERGEIAYFSATLSSYRHELQNLRAAVRAADAMARALLDKSSGAHECNGGPERCWYCADAESDRAVVSAFDQARAKGDV